MSSLIPSNFSNLMLQGAGREGTGETRLEISPRFEISHKDEFLNFHVYAYSNFSAHPCWNNTKYYGHHLFSQLYREVYKTTTEMWYLFNRNTLSAPKREGKLLQWTPCYICIYVRLLSCSSSNEELTVVSLQSRRLHMAGMAFWVTR